LSIQDSDIKCPNCGELIDFNETLTAPVISRIKAEADETVRTAKEVANAKVLMVTALEATLVARERELADKEASVQTVINQKLATERLKIAATERENALKELSPEIEAERDRVKELQEKLTATQTAELQLRQQKDAIDQRGKDLELEVARKVDEQRRAIHEQVSKDAEAVIAQRLVEKDNAILELKDAAAAKTTLATSLAATLAAKERELVEKEASVQTVINQTLATERLKIAATERENALKELSPEIEAERDRVKELQEKLTATQTAELQLRQQKDAIDQRGKDLELEVARKVDAQRRTIHEQVSKDAEEATKLKIAERDKTIADMQVKLEEAQRKATQGSQQLQGEVLETDFEGTLRQMFPQDTIDPVKTGLRGGDILQHVFGGMGRAVGTMLWEAKRAQAWSGDWTTKAKQDAADAKAEVAIIVSEVLPKGLRDFGLHERVWCVKPTHAVMLGVAIRQGIISTSEARQSSLGRETKKEMLYAYMIGPDFRATIEGIALPFNELHDELMAEKRATLARWKRQEKRIERVLLSIASFQGDLQGIAGSEMPQLPGFGPDGRALEDPGTPIVGPQSDVRSALLRTQPPDANDERDAT
jgi:hypothetical protein